MSSIFTQMLNGRITCHRLFENERFISILEPNPLTDGHALVFPKKESDALFDLPDETLSEMILFSKKTARAIRAAIPCEKIAVVAYGLKVRHAHLHLVPVDGAPGELNLSAPRAAADNKKLAEIALKIKSMG